MATSQTIIGNLIVNKLESYEVYKYLKDNNLLSEEEIYIVEGLNGAVLFTEQTLTDEQKEQVRQNIGAASVDDIVITKSDVGLGNVDNTSDVNKPVSTAQQTAINEAKTAVQTNLNTHANNTNNPHSVTKSQVGLGNVTNESKETMFTSPNFTGTPTAPTAAMNTNTNQIATTAYVMTAVGNISASDLGLTAAMRFIGTSETELTDGSTVNPITVSGNELTATAGGVALYGNKEFVWNGASWEILGDEGSYALKTISVTAGDGLTGGGNLESNFTISHALGADGFSSLLPDDDDPRYVTSLIFDKFGHVTGLTANRAFKTTIKSWTIDNISDYNKLTFTIRGLGDETFTAEKGMTWGEWIESEYNTENVSDLFRIRYSYMNSNGSLQGGNVYSSSEIDPDYYSYSYS